MTLLSGTRQRRPVCRIAHRLISETVPPECAFRSARKFPTYMPITAPETVSNSALAIATQTTSPEYVFRIALSLQ